jgi:hypothetical protein
MPEPTGLTAVDPVWSLDATANDAVSPDRSYSAFCREDLYRSGIQRILAVEQNTLALDALGIARSEPSLRTTRWQFVSLVQKAPA